AGRERDDVGVGHTVRRHGGLGRARAHRLQTRGAISCGFLHVRRLAASDERCPAMIRRPCLLNARALTRFVVALSRALALAGGADPLDRPLVTGEGRAAFRASLEPIAEKMTPEQREAFEWAVSDFDLERLHREYP